MDRKCTFYCQSVWYRYYKVHVKVQTLDSADYLETHLRSAGTCCKGSHSFICKPMHLFANGINHALDFPAKADPHFTDPREMEGRVNLLLNYQLIIILKELAKQTTFNCSCK